MPDKRPSQSGMLDEVQQLRQQVDELQNALATEAALAKEREHLQAVMDGLAEAGIGVDVVDRTFRVLYQNRLLRERFGDLEGSRCHTGYMGREERCEPCPAVEAIETGRPASLDLTGRDGRRYTLLAAPLADDAGEITSVLEVVLDITEHSRATDALRRSEAQYRALFESAQDAIFLLTSDGCVACNRKTLDMFACTREDVLKHPPWEFSPPQQPDGGSSQEKAQVMLRLAFEGETQRFDWLHLRGDGTPFDAEVTLSRVDLETGPHLLALVRDISIRKGAERSLRESEERFRSLIESSATVVLFLDPEYRILEFNPEAERIFGRSRADVLGSDYVAHFVPEKARAAIAADIRKVLGGDATRGFENEVIAADGATRVFIWNVDRVLDTEGTAAGIVAVGLDVTTHRHAQLSLQRRVSLEHLVTEITARFLERGSEDLDACIDRSLEQIGRFVSADRVSLNQFLESGTRFSMTHEWCASGVQSDRPRWQSMANADVEWAVAQTLQLEVTEASDIDGLPPEASAFRELLARGGVKSGLLVPLAQSGQAVGSLTVSFLREGATWQDEDRALLTLAANAFASALAQAATRKELERQRLLSVRSDRLRALGEMAAGIAHELNQPLVGVRGIAEHLMLAAQRGWDLPTDSVEEKARTIVEQADRMTHVIQHARQFARGANNVDIVDVDVNEVVRSAVGILGAQLRARGIVLECELADRLPSIEANPFSLEEVVLNLVVNARDAAESAPQKDSDSRRPSVRILTSLDESESTPQVKIEVIDTGPGMGAEVLQKAFEPFYSTKSPDSGTGLGLSISKTIVEQHDGDIMIESELGKGTVVTIIFPAGAADEERGRGEQRS